MRAKPCLFLFNWCSLGRALSLGAPWARVISFLEDLADRKPFPLWVEMN